MLMLNMELVLNMQSVYTVWLIINYDFRDLSVYDS